MMGIYIESMQMPRHCMECEIAIEDNDYDKYCPFTKVECLNIARQVNCPLIEVPEPHGDLVDHSEIGKILIKALDECEISEADKGHVLRMVWITPTIIEGTE